MWDFLCIILVVLHLIKKSQGNSILTEWKVRTGNWICPIQRCLLPIQHINSCVPVFVGLSTYGTLLFQDDFQFQIWKICSTTWNLYPFRVSIFQSDAKLCKYGWWQITGMCLTKNSRTKSTACHYSHYETFTNLTPIFQNAWELQLLLISEQSNKTFDASWCNIINKYNQQFLII